MKEKITIVLNEREPEKAKLAERLESTLNDRGFLAGRIELTDSLINRLAVRAPTVIITDYVLGDVTTGLDLLATLKTKKSASSVVFYTDEPSASVALKALKNGAVDYYLMNAPNAFNELVERVTQIINAAQATATEEIPECGLPALDQLVAESTAARKWREEIMIAGGESAKVTVLVGPKGAGRTFSANLIHRLRGHLVPQLCLSWELVDIPLQDILEKHRHVVLDAGVDVSPELLKELDALDWGRAPAATVYLKSTTAEFAKAITKVMSATRIVHVPSLTERLDDISGIVKLNTRDLPRSKAANLTPSNITKISNMSWPGEFKQLIGSLRGVLQIDNDESDFVAKLQEFNAAPNNKENKPNISRLRALATLREAGSYRIAAIALGCSVQYLREITLEQHE